MDVSAEIPGTQTSASLCGRYIASITNSKLRISSTVAIDRYALINVRPTKDLVALKWDEQSTRIAVLSAQSAEVIDVDDDSYRVRIENGSGSLGRLTSADFVGSDHFLVIWEFGRSKLWDLLTGKIVDLADVKTGCGFNTLHIRPSGNKQALKILATLSRFGADDLLNIYLPQAGRQLTSTKLPTIDAQSLSWSPDGRWLAVLDTPTANSSIHIFTADGHRFRSYPAAGDNTSSSLGVKSYRWSANSQILALTKFDGRIVLLNTKTFAPLAIIEHTTTVDQRSLPENQQAPVWQEFVAVGGERSYSKQSQPISPPLSRTKPSTEPSELGVAECSFSCDGGYLVTKDERMLNTVWIWNMATLVAYTVLIQHNNVRRLTWHPTRPELLMIDCTEGIAYVFTVGSSDPPKTFHSSISAPSSLSWLNIDALSNPVVLSTTKTSFRTVCLEGLSASGSQNKVHGVLEADDYFDEGASEDSLFDVLSGRKPMPPKTEQSYTERLDLEVETEEEDLTTRMDDTFRGMQFRRTIPADPLDDSQIF